MGVVWLILSIAFSLLVVAALGVAFKVADLLAERLEKWFKVPQGAFWSALIILVLVLVFAGLKTGWLPAGDGDDYDRWTAERGR